MRWCNLSPKLTNDALEPLINKGNSFCRWYAVSNASMLPHPRNKAAATGGVQAVHTLNNVSDFYIQWFSQVLPFGMSALLKLSKILLYWHHLLRNTIDVVSEARYMLVSRFLQHEGSAFFRGSSSSITLELAAAEVTFIFLPHLNPPMVTFRPPSLLGSATERVQVHSHLLPRAHHSNSGVQASYR